MTTLALTDVVIDDAIYPRARWYERAVARYVDALAADEQLPPITLEIGTNRLIDGMHRWRAHREAERTEIAVEYVDIPEGIAPVLFAADLNARHGLALSDDDQQALARTLFAADEGLDVGKVAKALGRPRRTVQDWISEQVAEREKRKERERAARSYAAALLRDLGWTLRRVGEALGITKDVVSSLGDVATTRQLDEAFLRAGIALVPDDVRADAEAVAEKWREDRMFAAWSEEERELLATLRDGEEIVVSYRRHEGLISYCDGAGLLARVDRRSKWGNPFETPADGDRETVIANYRDHYLPHKPSLRRAIPELVGKALACWCAPEPCHGDVLIDLVSAEQP